MIRARNKAVGSLSHFQNTMMSTTIGATNVMAQMASTSSRFKSPAAPTVNSSAADGTPYFICGRTRCGAEGIVGP